MNYINHLLWHSVYFPLGANDKLGFSLELSSFDAGVMISTTDFPKHTLDQVESVRNLFASVFLASIVMLIHVHFLWIHVDILVASVILVIIVKTTVFAATTEASAYNLRMSAMLSDVLKKLDGKLKATEAQVENKNLELKKANDEKKKSSSYPICCRSDSSKSL